MIVYLKGIAATGPGFRNWDTLSSHFSSGVALDPDFIPSPHGTMLPGPERRRASTTVKLAVDVAHGALRQSGMKAGDLAVVFASSNGDTNTIHHICDALATPERVVSPMRFHNSVHNAPVGYWSIAAGSMQPSSSLCALGNTFAAGLVEAATQCLAENVPVLLAVFDTPFPEPLYQLTPGRLPFGVAMVLDTNPNAGLAAMTIAIEGDVQLTTTQMDDPLLETLRCDSSASRSLPLLAALAVPAAQQVVLDYAEGLRITVLVDHLLA